MAATQNASARAGAGLPAWRRARRHAFHAVVRLLAAGAGHGPRSCAEAGLRALAVIAWATRAADRRRAFAQLARAFPDWSPSAREAVARRAMGVLALDLLDMLRADRPVSVEAEAARRLRDERARGRPLLVLMAHLGAFELAGPVLARWLPPFAALTADPHNPAVARWLRRQRAERGVPSFDRETEVLAAARWLRRGGSLAVLADLNGRGATLGVPWFGRPAPTVTGPARLARAGRARILPVAVTRRPDGKGHRLKVATGFEPEGTVEEVSARCNQALEHFVREAPEEWLWFHDRYGDGP